MAAFMQDIIIFILAVMIGLKVTCNPKIIRNYQLRLPWARKQEEIIILCFMCFLASLLMKDETNIIILYQL